MAALLGDRQLERRLNQLARRGSRKAMTAGIRASMTPIAKAMRAGINSTSASAALKREARKTIGKRFAKDKAGAERGVKKAKVGFSVGKSRSRAKPTRGGQSGGVGVSSSNIHWFVLGTSDRQTTQGQATGKLTDVFGEVTKSAFASSTAESLAAARAKISEVIQREARRA